MPSVWPRATIGTSISERVPIRSTARRSAPKCSSSSRYVVRDRAQEQRLGVLEHVCDLPRLVREREGCRERLEHRLRRRIGGDARDPGEHAVAKEIDVAGVRQPRHADTGDPRRDLVLVERGREELAGLRQQAQAVVGSLPVRDLHDHRADSDHLALGRVHRVVAREPVAALAHLQSRVVGGFGVHDRLARLEHASIERNEDGRELADDVAEITADMRFRREPVDRRERVVDPDEAEVAIPESDPDRRRDEQRVQLRVRLLRRAEQERIVDRERRPPRQLPGEREVELAEAAAGLAGPERDRPEHPAARLERHDDVRQRLQPAVEGEMLVVDGGIRERVDACVLDEIGLPGREHLRDGMRLVRVRRIPLAELSQQLLALRVAVHDHDLAQPVAVDHVDDAVVGEARHEQRGEGIEGRIDVDRGGEDGAGLVEQLRPLARGPLGRDVVDDVDHEVDAPGLRHDRRRADERPALVPVGQEPVADDPLLRPPGGEGAPVRELGRRQRRPILPDHQEAPAQLASLQPDQLVARAEAEQPGSRVVRVCERSVHALRRDPVGDVAEDDVELVRDDRRRGHSQKYRDDARRLQGQCHAAQGERERSDPSGVLRERGSAPADSCSCAIVRERSDPSGVLRERGSAPADSCSCAIVRERSDPSGVLRERGSAPADSCSCAIVRERSDPSGVLRERGSAPADSCSAPSCGSEATL